MLTKYCKLLWKFIQDCLSFMSQWYVIQSEHSIWNPRLHTQHGWGQVPIDPREHQGKLSPCSCTLFQSIVRGNSFLEVSQIGPMRHHTKLAVNIRLTTLDTFHCRCQATIWSLNTPLCSWWRRSGVKHAEMSQWGKSHQKELFGHSTISATKSKEVPL